MLVIYDPYPVSHPALYLPLPYVHDGFLWSLPNLIASDLSIPLPTLWLSGSVGSTLRLEHDFRYQ